MKKASATLARPDPAIIREMAVWLARLAEGDLTAQDWERLQAWRARSTAHELAWQQAEQLRGRIAEVPPTLGRSTLDGAARLQSAARRRVLYTLLPLAVTLPTAYLAWRTELWSRWSAQYRTRRGQWQAFELPDGTRMVLNTASAVDLDFNADRRQVELRAGEVLLETSRHHHPADPRPFLVRTPHGLARPLGTRFLVRLDKERTAVAVSEGAVQIIPLAGAGQSQIISAGQHSSFSRVDAAPPEALDGDIGAWSNGILNADNTRLADFLAELGRYRYGLLRCDPAVADLRISGSFQLSDTTQALHLLEKSFPLRVRTPLPLWTVVEAR